MELGWGLTDYIPAFIYLTAIGCGILAIVKRVDIAIYFFVFFLPLQNILNYANEFPRGKDLNDFLLLCMIIGWIIQKRKKHEPLFEKTILNIPLIILTAYTFFETCLGSQTLGLGSTISVRDPLFVSWKNYMFSPLIYLIVVNNLKKKEQVKILVLIMALSILVLDRNFYNVIKYRDTSHYDENYLKVITVGTALGGNWLAVFLAQYAAVVLALFTMDKNIWRKIFFGVTAGLSYYCILFLFSRSGYLATVASLLVLGIVKDKKILLGLIVIFLFWTAILPTAVKERIYMTRTNDSWDRTTMERFGMWEQGKSMIREKPILGRGFDITAQIAVRESEFDDYAWNSFHNSYLQTLVEMGVVGLLLVLSIYGIGFYSGYKLFRLGKDGFQRGLGLGVMACVPAILFGNIAGSYWQYYNIIGFFYVYVALAHRVMLNLLDDDKREHISDSTERPTKVQSLRKSRQLFRRVNLTQ